MRSFASTATAPAAESAGNCEKKQNEADVRVRREMVLVKSPPRSRELPGRTLAGLKLDMSVKSPISRERPVEGSLNCDSVMLYCFSHRARVVRIPCTGT